MVWVAYNCEGASGGRSWHPRTDLPPAPLPTQQALRDAQRALWRHARRRGYLTRTRGLTRAYIRRYELGYFGGWVMPVRAESGELLTVVTHCPWLESGHGRYKVPDGSRAALYPTVPRGEAVVLVAGMFDALIGRQFGLPTVTTTCGALVPPELVEPFRDKRVAVVFDAGEQREAESVVGRLPCEAWAVDLPLPEGGDVSDWFVKYGRSRAELLQLIIEARP